MAVFRAEMNLTSPDLTGGKMILNFRRIDDLGWVFVNGEKIGETVDWARAYSFDATKQLRPGRNVIAVVVKNNDGPGGLGAPSLDRASNMTAVPLEVFGSPAGVEGQWWQPDFNDTLWTSVAIGQSPDSVRDDSMLNWYRMDFELPASNPAMWVPWQVRLRARGNGFIYLNGHALGRYWEAGPQHDFFLPECWLNFGPGRNNNLTLSLRPIEHGASIQSAVVEPYAEFAETRPVISKPRQ